MKTRITELLNIDYPIFQGGMAWVADGDLAGSVSKAGGLGIIGGGNAPKEVVKANIDKIKSLTDKPFGVNIMLLSPFVEDIVDLVIEEGVKVVTTGAGNPSKYMNRFHDAGITVIPVVPSVALAKRMEKIGADAVGADLKIEYIGLQIKGSLGTGVSKVVPVVFNLYPSCGHVSIRQEIVHMILDRHPGSSGVAFIIILKPPSFFILLPCAGKGRKGKEKSHNSSRNSHYNFFHNILLIRLQRITLTILLHPPEKIPSLL